MTTVLLAVYTSDGCVGRCDARCRDASEPECDCICGGRNHGVGQARAQANTEAMLDPDGSIRRQLLDDWIADHPDVGGIVYLARQAPMFGTEIAGSGNDAGDSLPRVLVEGLRDLKRSTGSGKVQAAGG